MSRLLSHDRYEALKSLAADVIEDYGFTYPLEPMQIADVLDVQVVVHPSWHPTIERLCASRDGFTWPLAGPAGQKFQSHVNGTMAPKRQRFTVMHELSHVLLDHLLARGATTAEIAESEANFLAGYLLAPDALITAWTPDYSVPAIARIFNVSQEAAQHSHRRLMRALNRQPLGADYDCRIAAAASRRLITRGFSEDEARGSA